MTNKIVKAALLMAVIMGAQTSANAQFGKFKELADKAKSTLNDKAKDAKSNAVGTATSQAGQAVGVSTADSDMPSANGVVTLLTMPSRQP